jgi:DNA-binding PadR family transcriptional regulator
VLALIAERPRHGYEIIRRSKIASPAPTRRAPA